MFIDFIQRGREREREEERERQTSHTHPDWGSTRSLGMFPDLESNPNLLVHGPTLQPNEP